MIILHASPYKIDATGFYFTDINEYKTKAKSLVDRYGNLVEEFEIQFIDGDDVELFEACGINQVNLNQWFNEVEFLQHDEKVSLNYLVGVAGYSLDQALLKTDEPSLYQGNLLDAATELFDECWLPIIPDSIRFYIDYDKFARDCQYAGDLTEFNYAGATYTCTKANSF